MFSGGQNCSWVENLSTQVFGDDGSSSWQVIISWFCIQESQQSLRRKSTERNKTYNIILNLVKAKHTEKKKLKKDMRNKEILYKGAMTSVRAFF